MTDTDTPEAPAPMPEDVTRFCAEWRKSMQPRGTKDGTIYGLHVGTEREAVLTVDMLEALSARADAMAAQAEALAELVSLVLETPSEFETEWDVDARTALAAYRAAKEGR